MNLISGNYIVEDAWFFSNSTSQYAKVTLRNTGDVAIKITTLTSTIRRCGPAAK